MASKEIELGDSDWIEIYYALLDKAERIKKGAYGPGRKSAGNRAWAGHLTKIAEAIADQVKV